MTEQQQKIQELEQQFAFINKERERKELIRSEEAKRKEEQYFSSLGQKKQVEVSTAKFVEHALRIISKTYEEYGYGIDNIAPYILGVLYSVTGYEGIRKAPASYLNHSYALRLGKDKEKVLQPFKSVCLIGDTGTGKTFMMDTIRKACNSMQRIAPQYGMGKMVHAKEICNGFSNKGTEYLDTIPSKTMVIDDLGTDRHSSNFGNKVNPVEEILQQERYQLFGKGVLTHFTTNLSVEELKDKYDKRTIDRLKEMCNFIELTNLKSFR